MPQYMQIVRDGEPLSLHWSWFHRCAIDHALKDEGVSRKAGWPNEFTFSEDHEFIDDTDNEHFAIQKGDVFKCWR